MKKYFLLIVVLGNFIQMNSQSIFNSINIGIGTSAAIPLNKNDINENSFQYPSLYGNYEVGFSGLIDVDFRLNNKFSISLIFDNSVFSNWSGDQNLFILSDPSLSLKNYLLSFKFSPEKYQFKNTGLKWGFIVAPAIASQKLKWSAINQDADNDQVYPKSEKIYLPGIRTGFEISHFETNSFEFCSLICYQYLKSNSAFYMDKAFHSINVSIIVKYKLLKNRYFKYV